MKELREYIYEATGDPSIDMNEMRVTIEGALSWYHVEFYMADYFSKLTMHELRDPLARVIEILSHHPNEHHIRMMALYETSNNGLIADIEAAAKRHITVLADLDKIFRSIPPDTVPKRGRPPGIKLRLLVGHLANYWLCTTNKQFAQAWLSKEPPTPATQFVRAFVRYIDPDSLKALPKATEWVVNQRLKGSLIGWFGDEARAAATSKK